MSNDRYYIYALVNPFNQQIFYVGITTKQVGVRLTQHIGKNDGTEEKNRAIRHIIAEGIPPYAIKLERCYGEANALNRERWWICQGISCGWPLTNQEALRANGGSVAPTLDAPPASSGEPETWESMFVVANEDNTQ